MERKTQTGYLVLADISGYTSFVAQTEIEHADMALSFLLETIVDLLQKSVEFKVVNSRDQVETQGKSLSAIAILLTQDPKHFQLAKNMLNQNSLSSQCPVFLLLLFGQRMIFGFLERRLAIFMKFCQTLVARICQNSNMLCNVEFLVLEKLEVMFATLAEGGGHYFSRLLVGNQ